MLEDNPRSRRYLRRLWIGAALLAMLAVPAIIHSNAAIRSLYNRTSDWVPDSLPEKALFNDFAEHFSVADLIMISWPEAKLGDPSLSTAADVLAYLCSEMNTVPVDQANDLPDWAGEWIEQTRLACHTDHPLRWVRSGDGTIDRMTAAPSAISRRRAIARLKGTLIGPDGKQTCLVASFDEDGLARRRILIPAIREMIGKLVNRPWSEIATVGALFDGATVDSESIRSIKTFSPPSALIAAILCLFCLRSVPLTVAIVAVAVIGEGLVLAAVYYTGTAMNAVLIVLPPLVFVLTVSAGIHLSNYYLDIIREFPEMSRGDAASGAMRAGVLPCSLATGTTVIGLLSLVLVRLEPVRIFGAVASMGVSLTLVLLFTVLPGAMVLTKRRTKPQAADDGSNDTSLRERIWQAMRKQLAHPWPIIVLFLMVSAVLSMGLGRLRSSVNIPRMFLPKSDIRQQYDWFEKNIGPTVTGEMLITFAPLTDGDDPIDRLAIVARAQSAVHQMADVGGTLSARTFVPSIPRGRGLRATAARSVVRKLVRDSESSLRKLNFIADDDDRQIWRISIRMPQDEHADAGARIAAIKETANKALADAKIDFELSVTGSVAIVQRSQEILLDDLFRSFVAAFGVIALVMIIVLRNVLGGLIAMLPNLFPTVALFGLMGLVNLPLDIGSVMSASVALGIAVDDTVHLLSRFASRRARGLGQIRAAYGALSQCGMAMIQTTLVCGIALLSYWFSDFVPTSRFSLFMFGLLLAALMGVTFLLPALMCSVLGRWLAKGAVADPKASVYCDQPEEIPLPVDVRRLPARNRSDRSVGQPRDSVGPGNSREKPNHRENQS